MAKLFSFSFSFSFSFFFFFFFFFLTSTTLAKQPDRFLQSESPHKPMRRKLSHLHFYWHDTVSGLHPSAIPVVRAPIKSSRTLFGQVNMIDDPLTVGPNISSQLVGHAQGFYASSSHESIAVLMAMNLFFTEGKYNGSTIAVLGRSDVLTPEYELPIVGGSGLFRFAKGYIQAKTFSLDMKTLDAVVEYNVFVTHY